MNKEEYKTVLEKIMAEYKKFSYSFWRDNIKSIISFEGKYNDQDYQVEIQAVWDDRPGGDIRVLFSIDDGGWRAYFPVGSDIILSKDRHS